MIEMSHRQPEFAEITDKLQREFRKFMKVPDDWQVYLMQGGATLQFSGIPINLACHTYGTDAARANYLITGKWTHDSAAEARKYLKVNSVIDTYCGDKTFEDDILDLDRWKFDKKG